MAKAKKPSKPAPKSAPKSAPKQAPKSKPNGKSELKIRNVNDRLRNARKLGERTETITELLSPSQVDAERAKVCDAHRELDRVEGDLKTLSAGHKARIKEIKATIATAVATANSAKRDVDVTIEEWVTDRNEVIRVRKDNGEIIGNRVAKLDELQEEMFAGDDDDDTDDDDVAAVDTDGPEAAPPNLKVVADDEALDEFGESEA